MDTFKIEYKFQFQDQSEHCFTVHVNETTLSQVIEQPHTLPDWTRLENQKCVHCPLDSKNNPHCPIAIHLSSLAEFFKDKISYEKAKVTVVTNERTYSKDLRIQEGIFSLFGLIIPLSGCPYTHFLKPMARFHLPFSTTQETIVRSVSLYLLKQYFVAKRNGNPDLTLTYLEKSYENLKKVNLGIISRLRKVAKQDAGLNAIIVLHAFADLLTFAISNDLSTIEPWFSFEQN